MRISILGAHNPTVTWEFPVLAKYYLPSIGIRHFSPRPFVEAGPSFRTAGNLNAYPSHTGISVGGGLNFRSGQLNVTPILRYTRWAQDPHPGLARTRADQIELLVDFSHSSSLSARPFGNKLSIGVVLGINFLGDYRSVTNLAPAPDGSILATSSAGPDSRSFLIGPAVDVHLFRGLSFEADAIHRPVRGYFELSEYYVVGRSTARTEFSSTTWQFPLLTKYTFAAPLFGRQLRAFLAAGPALRTGGSLSHVGFTVGPGLAAHFWHLDISPALRYSRWQDRAYTNARADELDLLIGFTF